MKTKKVLLVLPANEFSGSIVSALNLKGALEKYFNYQVDICGPKGLAFTPDIEIGRAGYSPIGQLKTLWHVSKHEDKYQLALFYTIKFAILSPFMRGKKALFLHEVDIGNSIFTLLAWWVNFFVSKPVLVNPGMRISFPRGVVLPNVVDVFSEAKKKDRRFDYIMLANFRASKGVYLLREIAEKNREKTFVLFTNIDQLKDKEEFQRYVSDSPDNLTIVVDQTKKIEMLSKANYLLNLSTMQETFGLTLIEAIQCGTVPLAFKNIGSEYVLPRHAVFLDSSSLNLSLTKAVEYLDIRYDEYLKELKEHLSKFSPCVIGEQYLEVEKELLGGQ